MAPVILADSAAHESIHLPYASKHIITDMKADNSFCPLQIFFKYTLMQYIPLIP